MFTARAKSPPKPTPKAVYEEITSVRQEAYERKRVVPGDLPKFKVSLPKVIELEEGDRLRLEARVDGLPQPNCMYYSRCFYAPTVIVGGV